MIQAIKKSWQRLFAKKIIDKQGIIKFVTFIDKSGITINRFCYVRGWKVDDQEMIDEFEGLFLKSRSGDRRGKKVNYSIRKSLDDIRKISESWKPN